MFTATLNLQFTFCKFKILKLFPSSKFFFFMLGGKNYILFNIYRNKWLKTEKDKNRIQQLKLYYFKDSGK